MTRLGRIGKWGRRSLLNQILLCEAVIAAPTFLIFCVANYLEGTLTIDWAVCLLVLTVLEGIAFALPTWFLFVAPRAKKAGRYSPKPAKGIEHRQIVAAEGVAQTLHRGTARGGSERF
jgi:hypothetical protein